jgi:hypothetical protein
LGRGERKRGWRKRGMEWAGAGIEPTGPTGKRKKRRGGGGLGWFEETRRVFDYFLFKLKHHLNKFS